MQCLIKSHIIKLWAVTVLMLRQAGALLGLCKVAAVRFGMVGRGSVDNLDIACT